MFAKTLANRYRLDSFYKDSKFSTIFRGWDEQARMPRAIKALKLENLPPDEMERAKQVFIQEIEMLKNLKSPYFPEYYDFIVEEKACYLIMEWIEGKDLKSVMMEKPKLSQEGALWYMEKVAQTLVHLQDQETILIYKDLKPTDIMVDKIGNVRLLDFTSTRIGRALNKVRIGSFRESSYIAPELIVNEEDSDLSSDVFSLGAIMFHMITGEDPAQFAYNFPPLTQYNPEISPKFEKVILDCLQEQEKRTPDMKSLVAQLSKATEPAPETIKKKVQNPMDNPIIGTIIFFAALVVLGFAYRMYTQHASLVTVGIMAALTGPYCAVYILYKLERIIRSLIKKKRFEMDPSVLFVLAGIATVIGGIAAAFYITSLSTIQEAKLEATLAGCENNCKVISLAVETYAHDNPGKGYPTDLKQLIPRYLKAVPRCPAVKRDTYSATYECLDNHSKYIFYCQGGNHKDILKIDGNWPQYTQNGLRRTPGSDDIFKAGHTPKASPRTSPQPQKNVRKK